MFAREHNESGRNLVVQEATEAYPWPQGRALWTPGYNLGV